MKVLRKIIYRGSLNRKLRRDFDVFKNMISSNRPFHLSWREHQAMYENDTETRFDAHYIYHPSWAARILAVTKPAKHVDFSSTLYFCSIVSAFIPVDFYDYRPANIRLSNLTSKRADLTALPFLDNSIDSLSCMHVIEHIGLGRYGDPLDPEGDLKAVMELKRVAAHGGTILFVVPIGKPQIIFNAHRIYSYDMVMSMFDGFELKDFSMVPDNGEKVGLIPKADPAFADKQSYGCGCFWFVKP
ncbi:DUF268 domain-containing protein [Patescibacteria group bacterium]|nr:DUF268 domain-containing protein [Patescibacteria group bacterium]MDE1946814.1 DUF268 domain-containing protein [Patescibacteria group bacterium]MDE2011152.1 DUF268 domain-containing protein [Patescibacteria group bacterium]MDE2233061.1 DUF268 domain-containing protein [Patescibacteria group bacterium]